MKTIPTALALAGLASAGILAGTATPATAAGGGGGVTKTGACSATSTWKLKVKNNNGALEVAGEVDSNVVGQTWKWAILDNAVRRAAGTAVTTGPSGSFSVGRNITNQAGADKVVFRATNPASGESCRGSITF